MIWSVLEIPRWEIRSGDSRVMSSPLKRILPAVAVWIPVIRLRSVVFPAPLGPISARSSPFRTARLA